MKATDNIIKRLKDTNDFLVKTKGAMPLDEIAITYIQEHIDRMLNWGWKEEDAYQYFRNSEEVNSTLDEETALERIDKIASKYNRLAP